jgi:polyphosphate glucokinase
VNKVVEVLSAAFKPDDVVIGGGNLQHLAELPPGCRAGNNANAFIGGFRLWKHDCDATTRAAAAVAVI